MGPSWGIEPRRHLARRVLRFLTLGLSALCFAWVVWSVWRHAEELRAIVRGTELMTGVLGGMAGYALISVLLAVAWWWLAGLYGRPLTALAGYSVWARSQWAKYLPGNAFHYVSRQVLGRRAGLSHPALVASGVLELGSLLLAAVLVVSFWSSTDDITDLSPRWLMALVLGAVLLTAWPMIDALLRRWLKKSDWLAELPQLSWSQIWRLVAPALLLHVLFFAVTGALFHGLLVAGWGTGLVEAGRMVRLFAVAWLAGTVTLGAPAGAGVREAIITLQLGSVLGPANAATLALALRLVTLGGDCLSALCGWWLRDRLEGPPESVDSLGA